MGNEVVRPLPMTPTKLTWSLATETQRGRIQGLAATVRRLTAENHRLRGELKRRSK